MQLTKIRLGDHIKRINIKNKDGALGLEKYVSASYTKELTAPKQAGKLRDSDPTQFKVVKKGQFVFRPMVDFVDGLNGGRLYADEALVSAAYEVFEVCSDVLDPEYMRILFSLSEFDAHAFYYAHGTARRVFSWNKLCAMNLEIPALEDQQRVVSTFQKLNRLIDLKLDTLKTLQELGSNLFRQQFCRVSEHSTLIVKPSDTFTFLSDCATLKQGPRPYQANLEVKSERSKAHPYPAFTNSKDQGDIFGFVNRFDSVDGPLVTVDRIAAATRIRYQPSYAVNGVFTLRCDETKCTPEYLYYYLKNTVINTTGTITQRQESTFKSLGKHKVYLADLEKQKQFSEQVRPLLKLAEQCVYDLYELRQLRKAWLTDFRPELLAKAAV